MKQLIIWSTLLIVIAACAGKKNTVKIAASEETENAADSVEYELLTFDNRFETWYDMHNSPARYRSKEYYESWNKQYVTAWNIHAMSASRGSFFEPIVGWEPTVDYGFELNHKLFYYFMYVENVLKIPILDGRGPHDAMLYAP